MPDGHGTNSVIGKVTSALGALLLIAVVIRVAWVLLAPAVPMLVVAFCLVVILGRLLGIRRW